MDGEKRKRDAGGGVEGKKAKVEGDHRETVTEEEVEEFFAILRRIHVAAKHLGKTDDGLTASMKWRPSFEVQDFVKIQGRDKHGRKVLRIVGKFFPARSVSNEAVNNYLEEKIFPNLGEGPFSVVYLHTDVNRSGNFPGISTLRSIYDAIPITLKDRLQAVYFVHPGLQARLFLATFGRLLFKAGLYKKLKYVNRLEFLWDQVRRNEVEVPEFVYDHDEELEYRPMMDYGLESDHPRPRVYVAPCTSSTSMMDSTFVSMYSMRCIA